MGWYEVSELSSSVSNPLRKDQGLTWFLANLGWDGRAFRKVPRVLAIFWVIKVLTTALGESTSDYLVHAMLPEIAVGVGFVGLVIALAIQFSVRTYLAWAYWLAVLMVAIFGTMAADVLHIQFHVPYSASTVFFAVVLAVIFFIWYRAEHTLSIHTIYNPRREVFYWATVMATFALGTATGDLTARSVGLGFFWSGILFAGLISVPAVAYRYFGMNAIFAFWFAYVLTRPLGASFADWMGKGSSLGGLGWGDGTVSAGFTIVLVGLVAYLVAVKPDVEPQVESGVGPAQTASVTG